MTNESDKVKEFNLYSFQEWCLWDAQDDCTNFQRNFSTGTVEVDGSFISNYPHADIISNTRIDCLQNYFKNNNFRCWKRKATLIKETAKQSYPLISKNDELVYNLSQMVTLIKTYQNEINKTKLKLIE